MQGTQGNKEMYVHSGGDSVLTGERSPTWGIELIEGNTGNVGILGWWGPTQGTMQGNAENVGTWC